MKNLLTITILFFLNTINAQTKMKIQDIKISDNLILSQKETQDSNKILYWSMTLKNNKAKKTILLNTAKINIAQSNTMGVFSQMNDTGLDIPNLFHAFKSNDCLYVFLYIERVLWLYEYQFKGDKFTNSRKEIMKLPSGSIENYGGYFFEVNESTQIENKKHFNIRGGRNVIAKGELLLTLNLANNKLTTFKYSNDVIKIPDENQTFRTLDLDTNKEIITTELKRALLVNKSIKEFDKVEYLGFIDDMSSFYSNQNNKRRSKGVIYFFYKTNNGETKIIKYNNYDSEWQIGDYTEEEIKSELPKNK